MYCKDLLLKVFAADVVEGATYNDCVQLLDGAIRFRVAMSDEVEDEVMTWLLDTYGPVDWPEEPRVGLLVNGYDGPRDLWQYSLPDARFMRPPLRQDAHVIEFAANWFQRKETTVTDGFTGNKEFVEVEKHESPEGVEVCEIAPEEVTSMLEVAVIESIWTLGEEGLAAKTVRQLKAMCRLLSCRIGGKKADIVARLADLARLEETPEAVGDPKQYLVSLEELLPHLAHRTPDGRWYLKNYRINFVLELDGRVLRWSQKGLVPKKWTKFEGEAMLVPAVVAS